MGGGTSVSNPVKVCLELERRGERAGIWSSSTGSACKLNHFRSGSNRDAWSERGTPLGCLGALGSIGAPLATFGCPLADSSPCKLIQLAGGLKVARACTKITYKMHDGGRGWVGGDRRGGQLKWTAAYRSELRLEAQMTSCKGKEGAMQLKVARHVWYVEQTGSCQNGKQATQNALAKRKRNG